MQLFNHTVVQPWWFIETWPATTLSTLVTYVLPAILNLIHLIDPGYGPCPQVATPLRSSQLIAWKVDKVNGGGRCRWLLS